MADDLLPCKPDNARRRVNDAEVVTLCVAQSIMGCPEDPCFLARARKEIRHLFPESPQAARPLEAPPPTRGDDRAPGSRSSPPNAPAPTTTSSSSTRPRSNAGARSRPRGARRLRRGARAATAQHSRHFWGMRLHGVFGADGTPRAWGLAPANVGERGWPRRCPPRPFRAARWSSATRATPEPTSRPTSAPSAPPCFAPPARTSPGAAPTWAPIRQRIESIFRACKDILTLERHGVRTITGLRARVASRMLELRTIRARPKPAC